MMEHKAERTAVDDRARVPRAVNARSRARWMRLASRGVTLVEVLIVVAIMAVIAGGATVLVFPQYKKARIDAARLGCGTVKDAAELYMNLDAVDEGCPTMNDLVSAKKLDPQKTDDPWGRPYRISCEEGEIRVHSNGNDRQEGTADDIRDNMKPSDLKRISEL